MTDARMNQATPLFRAAAWRGAALAVGMTLFAAAPAAAQGGQPIVVEGERLPANVVRERAAAFIEGTGVASGSTPAARWVDPVCPRVLGLNEAGTRAAETRIRAVAAAAGAEVAPAPCDSNIVVTFAPDAASLVREIDRRSPGRLAQVPLTARDALLNGAAPIRWWYSAETRGRHNEGSQRVQGASGQYTPRGEGAGAGASFGGEAPTSVHYNSSIVSTLTTRALVSAGVVIDQDRVMGMRLNSLADFAALVALAEIRSQDFSGQGTVLNLFAGQGAPSGLTAQDLAFLRALYAMPLDREARRHRGHLVGEMVAAATGGVPDGN